MVYRSKIDAFFVNFMLIIVLILAIATFFPFFLEGGTDLPVVLILTSTFVITVSFILWSAFSVKYVFYEDYLYVKGGPFRSRIRYEHISKISPTKDIFTGYRILSSRDAIEIFYKTGFSGSVKVSPENKEEFIEELKKRCPYIIIQL